MKTDGTLVPELGRFCVLFHQLVVELQRGREIATQDVNLGHGLEVEPAVLASVERELVLPQRIVIVALLPQRQSQVVVSQKRAGDGNRGSGAAGPLGRMRADRSSSVARTIRCPHDGCRT